MNPTSREHGGRGPRKEQQKKVSYERWIILGMTGVARNRGLNRWGTEERGKDARRIQNGLLKVSYPVPREKGRLIKGKPSHREELPLYSRRDNEIDIKTGRRIPQKG